MSKNRTTKTRRLRILLADDHELVRRGIRGLLSAKREWMVVGEAADGFEAIEKSKRLKPDVVILDIDMPGLNGLEAAPRIREVAPHARIIILTLHESGEMVRRALEAGAQGVVLKSDLAERLMAAMRQISSAKPCLTPKVSELVVRGFLSDASNGKRANPAVIKPTSREAEVIRLLAEGKANKEVAAAMGISVRTAEAHRANIMKKLDLRSLADIVRYALGQGMVPKSPLNRQTAEN